MRFHKLSTTKKKGKKKQKFFFFVLPFCHSPTFGKLTHPKLFSFLNEPRDGFFHAHLSSDWRRNSLAFAVLQVEMRIEVDEDPLVRTRRRYHPCASLRRGIRQGVSWRGEVAGRRDPDVTATFICRRKTNSYEDLFTFGSHAEYKVTGLSIVMARLDQFLLNVKLQFFKAN